MKKNLNLIKEGILALVIKLYSQIYELDERMWAQDDNGFICMRN